MVIDNKKEMETSLKNNAVAIFDHPVTNERIFVMKNLIGGLYLYCQTVDGVVRSSLNKLYLRFMQNEMEAKKSPCSTYNIWHICMCKDCINIGGRVFSHSQGDWDSHLRFVKNTNVFNFKTAQ